jgi:hypothetical protein
MYDLPAHLRPDLLRSLIEISCMVISYLYFGLIRQVYAIQVIDVNFPTIFSNEYRISDYREISETRQLNDL